MNKLIILLILLNLTVQSGLTQSKTDYLKSNRYDVRSATLAVFEGDFKIIGFGAYHGSAKTEEAELLLLKSFIRNHQIRYYLPETDFSTAFYFNEFLHNGDVDAIEELIHHYGKRVDQERAIEVLEKWKSLKKINDELDEAHKLKVVGIDPITSYAFTAKHLRSLVDNLQDITDLINIKIKTNDYTALYNDYLKSALESFASDYEKGKYANLIKVKDEFIFNHIINNINSSRNNVDREFSIYNNYIHLSDHYKFHERKQFVRFGFFHLEKEREYNTASFFTQLIENQFYRHQDVITIMGYLTKSKVLWDTYRDHNQKYLSHKTKRGFGIGDYWKEYFKGIRHLKKSRISDLTLFALNGPNSPYNTGSDLIEVRSLFNRPDKLKFANKPTLRFMDYAILISKSRSNKPMR